jgi:oxygen-independent coproporphyrinogen-3 oxidase
MTRTLGLYFHVPFCRHACPYCDFYKIELRERPARERLEFPSLLAREHELLLAEHPGLAQRPLDTLYFGGGTPSVLSPPGVAELLRRVRSAHPASDPEVTLEANPENLTPARCDAWRAAGVMRLSLGVQSFAARDLERLERLHAVETIERAVANARAAGFGNLSLDLMFALPGQAPADWLGNLARALELRPDHLSFYGLTIHEETPFHDESARGTLVLPDDGIQGTMYREGAALLESAGFEHYEISNFARPGFRSRHNQRYWTREDVVGLGPGAHSSLGALRWANPPDLDGWRRGITADRLARTPPEDLDRAALLGERLFCAMRRVEGFDLAGADSDLAPVLRSWVASPVGRGALREGWCQRDPGGGRIVLTREGWLRSDALLATMLDHVEPT